MGVTERANCFAALRALARQVTTLWLERREELGHPLGTIPALPEAQGGVPQGAVTGAAPFVLEIGSEELPPDDVTSVVNQLRCDERCCCVVCSTIAVLGVVLCSEYLVMCHCTHRDAVPALLARLRLSHGTVEVHGTPRRVAVLIANLAAKQPDAEERVRGPPAKAAYAPDGAPTKALEGFCKKNGLSVGDCTLEADGKGVEYVWATVQTVGQSAAAALTPELSKLLASLSFTRSMRWNGTTAYSRPVRWLLALHGGVTLPVTFAGLTGGKTTRVLRTAEQPVQTVRGCGCGWVVGVGGWWVWLSANNAVAASLSVPRVILIGCIGTVSLYWYCFVVV